MCVPFQPKLDHVGKLAKVMFGAHSRTDKHLIRPSEPSGPGPSKQILKQVFSTSKSRIIFSSHNGNIVVNGDADLVVGCDYRTAGDQSGGQIKCRGAIDMNEIRNEITSVMEGGEKAFRLRKEKYGF